MGLNRLFISLPVALWASLCLITVAGLGGLWLGYAEDIDSLGIARSAAAINAGGYERSRVYGVPLYELIAAGLSGAGGLVLANFGSMAFALGACLCLWAALRRAGGQAAPYALLAAMCQPLILINASAMMETAFVALCICAALAAAVEAARARALLWTALAAAACAACVGARPDAALFALAVGLSLALEARSDLRRAALTLAIFACFGVMGLGLYGVMNGGFAFVADVAVTQDNAGRSFGRAVLGFVTLSTLPGLAALAVMAFGGLRRVRSAVRGVWTAPAAQRVLAWIAVISGALYALRFLALPDELEYLLPAFLAVLAALGAFAPRLSMAALAASLLLANVVQVALFARDGEAVRFTGPSLQPGALVQDWNARTHNLWLRSDQTRRQLAALTGAPGAAVDDAHLWLNGVAFAGGGLAIGADQVYRFADTGAADDPHVLANYHSVVVCDAPLVLRRGWRVMQPLAWGTPDPAALTVGCRALTRPTSPDAASSGAAD